MNPRARAIIQVAILLGVVVLLFLLFPSALQFAQLATRSLRYFWWLILLVALAVWLIWGLGRKRK